MTVWKVRHKPTGLFLGPCKQLKHEGRYRKTNLSKSGKIYTRQPNLEALHSQYGGKLYFYEHEYKMGKRESLMDFVQEDFEVIEL